MHTMHRMFLKLKLITWVNTRSRISNHSEPSSTSTSCPNVIYEMNELLLRVANSNEKLDWHVLLLFIYSIAIHSFWVVNFIHESYCSIIQSFYLEEERKERIDGIIESIHVQNIIFQCKIKKKFFIQVGISRKLCTKIFLLIYYFIFQDKRSRVQIS